MIVLTVAHMYTWVLMYQRVLVHAGHLHLRYFHCLLVN